MHEIWMEEHCPKCGTDVLRGSVEDVWPLTRFSRTPVTRESAQALTEARRLVMAAKRTQGGIVTQFWRDELGPAWTALKQHDCEVWR